MHLHFQYMNSYQTRQPHTPNVEMIAIHRQLTYAEIAGLWSIFEGAKFVQWCRCYKWRWTLQRLFILLIHLWQVRHQKSLPVTLTCQAAVHALDRPVTSRKLQISTSNTHVSSGCSCSWSTCDKSKITNLYQWHSRVKRLFMLLIDLWQVGHQKSLPVTLTCQAAVHALDRPVVQGQIRRSEARWDAVGLLYGSNPLAEGPH